VVASLAGWPEPKDVYRLAIACPIGNGPIGLPLLGRDGADRLVEGAEALPRDALVASGKLEAAIMEVELETPLAGGGLQSFSDVLEQDDGQRRQPVRLEHGLILHQWESCLLGPGFLLAPDQPEAESLVGDVRVDLRRLDVFVPEEPLSLA
jgi:hypothetical protein